MMRKLGLKVSVVLGSVLLVSVLILGGLVMIGRERIRDKYINGLDEDGREFSSISWRGFVQLGWDLVWRRSLQIMGIREDRLLVMERTFYVVRKIDSNQVVLVGKDVHGLTFEKLLPGKLIGKSSKNAGEVSYKTTDYFKVVGRQCISAITQPTIQENINDQIDYSDTSNLDKILLTFPPGKEWVEKEPEFLKRFGEVAKPGDYLKVYVDKATNEAVAVYLFTRSCL
ncbi:MAG TPA: hypothetical protein VLH94_03080 [Spirochaetia bacterium]|nr:hypothetical protein [Spirochaetia bacterium]